MTPLCDKLGKEFHINDRVLVVQNSASARNHATLGEEGYVVVLSAKYQNVGVKLSGDKIHDFMPSSLIIVSRQFEIPKQEAKLRDVPHAELIYKWLTTPNIQVFYQRNDKQFYPVKNPTWDPDIKYELRDPEKWQYAVQLDSGKSFITDHLSTDEWEIQKEKFSFMGYTVSNFQKLEYSKKICE